MYCFKVQNEASKGFSNKRIIVGVVTGVVAVAAVATIILVSVYFGSEITTESFKVGPFLFCFIFHI
jgi:hypothetical protein